MFTCSKKIFCLSFVLFVNATFSLLFGIDVANIKGSYTPLKNEYKRCSPLQGAIWWESGLIRKYYDFGIVETETIKGNRVVIISGATVKLVRKLFHPVAGSFGVSINPNYVAGNLTAKTIGKIISFLESLNQDVEIEGEEQEADIEQSDEAHVATRKKKGKAKAKKSDKVVQLSNLIWSDDGFKRTFETTVKKKQKGRERLVRQFSRAILGSYEECGYRQHTDIRTLRYPLYATHSVLLAFLYRKVDEKERFKDYFDELQDGIREKRDDSSLTIFSEELSEGWSNDSYNINEVDDIDTRYKGQFETGIAGISDEFYEQAVYARIMKRYYLQAFPKLAYYSTIKIKGISVPDCMETTVRNFCNIILYDHQELQFNIGRYASSPLDESFKSFYEVENNKRADLVEKLEVHNAWAEVIENRPFVAYSNVIIKEAKRKIGAPPDSNGFIILGETLPEGIEGVDVLIDRETFTQVTIAGRKYFKINPERYFAYEVQPSLRNLIVLLNDFFGLNLYENVQSVFTSASFNKDYFPQLVEKLNLQYQGAVTELLDSSDQTNSGLSLSMKNEYDHEFNVSLKKNHGYISEEFQEVGFEAGVEKLLEALKQNFSDHKLWYKLMSLLIMESLPFDIFNRQVNFSGEIRYQLSFLLDLYDSQSKMKIIEYYLDNKEDDKKILSWIARLIKSLPMQADVIYHYRIIWKIFANKMQEKDEMKDAIADIAKRLSKMPLNDNVKDTFELLIRRNLGLAEAAAAASEGVKSNNKSIKKIAIKLFRMFLKNNRARLTSAEMAYRYDQVSIVASNLIQINDFNVKRRALILFEGLVAKRKAYDKALAAAGIGIKSADYGVQYYALRLFEGLVEKEQGYAVALAAAGIGIKSADYDVQQRALGLFERLVEKDQAFEPAVAAAGIGIKSMDSRVQIEALRLFEGLVEKEQGYAVAAKAASKGIKSMDSNIRIEAVRLFASLKAADKSKLSEPVKRRINDLLEAIDAARE